MATPAARVFRAICGCSVIWLTMEKEIKADRDVFASEIARHRQFRLIYRVVLGVLVIGGALLLVWAGFLVGPRAGWVVTIGLAAIGAGVVTMATRMDREHPDHLATSGPWSHGQVYSGAQDREIWNSMGKVIVRHQMGVKRLTKTTALADRPSSFLHRKGIHLIDVRSSNDHPGWFVITVFASPDLPTTMTDFGRGRGINNELLSHVPGYRKPGDPDLD